VNVPINSEFDEIMSVAPVTTSESGVSNQNLGVSNLNVGDVLTVASNGYRITVLGMDGDNARILVDNGTGQAEIPWSVKDIEKDLREGNAVITARQNPAWYGAESKNNQITGGENNGRQGEEVRTANLGVRRHGILVPGKNGEGSNREQYQGSTGDDNNADKDRGGQSSYRAVEKRVRFTANGIEREIDLSYNEFREAKFQYNHKMTDSFRHFTPSGWIFRANRRKATVARPPKTG
jgi:hypothetical protein